MMQQKQCDGSSYIKNSSARFIRKRKEEHANFPIFISDNVLVSVPYSKILVIIKATHFILFLLVHSHTEDSAPKDRVIGLVGQ